LKGVSDAEKSDKVDVDLIENPIDKSFASSVSAELSTNDITVDLVNPNKIRRSSNLRLKSHDPLQCYDVLDDMYSIYYDQEVMLIFYTAGMLFLICVQNDYQDKYAARPYMDGQEDLNNKMRSILIDWLVEVHNKYKLQTATLWLCVNIIDRYLSKVPIKRGKLQLVGVSSLFIACKFEEVYPPESRDFVHITDNAYSHTELLHMETEILNSLNYEIFVPTGYHFLCRYLNCIRASDNTRCLANYYAERNLQEVHMLEVKPRVFAGAAIYAALIQQKERYSEQLHGRHESCWSKALQEESNLKESDLLSCARLLVKNAKEEPITTSKRKLNAAKKKYSLEKFQSVALLALPRI
jgi:cyclin B